MSARRSGSWTGTRAPRCVTGWRRRWPGIAPIARRRATSGDYPLRDTNMKIHVTGGHGFLARWIVPLLRESHEVEVSDRESMDVTDGERVRAVLDAWRPDMVIHLAALCGAA